MNAVQLLRQQRSTVKPTTQRQDLGPEYVNEHDDLFVPAPIFKTINNLCIQEISLKVKAFVFVLSLG